ncbi:MAG: GYD domain-containing protein [Hyphomicrobiaceae bacterium]|nr:GYD domain-containing protein [Hyphomicrobiaceae bacterium]
MGHYLLRWQFSASAAKAMVAKPQDRTRPATELIESFGGKMHCYYFALGDYDGMGICEFPDHTSVTAASMLAASTGSFARFETTVLLTAQEAEEAMKQANAKSGSYKAPNA